MGRAGSRRDCKSGASGGPSRDSKDSKLRLEDSDVWHGDREPRFSVACPLFLPLPTLDLDRERDSGAACSIERFRDTGPRETDGFRDVFAWPLKAF